MRKNAAFPRWLAFLLTLLILSAPVGCAAGERVSPGAVSVTLDADGTGWFAYGSESAALRYCAPAGYSEHHTGLAFDAYVFTDEQKTYKLGDEDMPEVYNWIYNNCARFGFIHRYPGNKEALTGYGAESWHFRYVGIPHAAIIEEKNFCLEEYIDFIKDYSYDNYLVATGSDGATYAIYYEGVKLETVVIAEVKDANGNVITPASVSQQMPDKATLHLPIGDVPYEISGNNVDGFIVTVKLGN